MEDKGRAVKKGAPGKARQWAGALIICAAVGIVLTNLLGNPFAREEGKAVSREGRVDMSPGPASAVWEVVDSAPQAADLKWLSFAPNGFDGAALSLDGSLMVTRDGGNSWEPGHAPLSEGATFDGVLAFNDRRIALGAGYEDSAVTLLYETAGEGEARGFTWKGQEYEDLGGVAGASRAGEEGALMVGGGGLILRRQDGGWLPQKIPAFKEVTLFCAARSGRGTFALAAGDEGVVARSTDNGQTWLVVNQGRTKLVAFYAAAVNDSGTGLLGGENGQFLRTDTGGETWARVTGLTPKMNIQSLYLGDDGEGFAVGGDEAGDMPIILHTSDGGITWRTEAVRGVEGKIASVGRGAVGYFSVTTDGKILKRRTL